MHCYYIIYCRTAGLSGVVIGTTIGWNSPVTCLMMKHETCDPQIISLYMAGYFCLGTTLGGVVQGRLVAAVGYKLSAVVFDSAVLAGWLFLTQVECFPGRCRDEDCYPDATSSQDVWIGRLVQGFGTGGLGLLTPTYISHITHFGVRGNHVITFSSYLIHLYSSSSSSSSSPLSYSNYCRCQLLLFMPSTSSCIHHHFLICISRRTPTRTLPPQQSQTTFSVQAYIGVIFPPPLV